MASSSIFLLVSSSTLIVMGLFFFGVNPIVTPLSIILIVLNFFGICKLLLTYVVLPCIL